MPTYTVQGPDGKTYTIDGPAGATADQLGSFITSQNPNAQRLAAFKAQNDAEVAAINPTDGMSTFDKVAAGAGKAVHDAGQGVGQLLGLTSRQDVVNSRQDDAALMNTGAGMAGNIGGNVLMALAPGGVTAGAGKLLTKVPAAADLAQALMTGGRAMMAPTSIPTAAAVGGAQGLLQPSTSTDETLKNIGVGTVASAAVPTAIRAAQVGKAFIDPLSQGGQRSIVGRALNDAAGSPQDAQIAQSNLRAANAPFVGPTPDGEVGRSVMGEIVPGSLPTTGQAAGVPSIAALSRSASAIDPASTNALSARLADQNAARVNQIEGVAGTGGARDFLEANRTAAGNQLYGDARKIGIDPAALTPEAQANIAAFQQRVPDEIMQRARDLAKINGVDMTNESSVQGLHWIKTAIDDKISTAARTGDKQLVSAYTGLQKTLLDGLDQLSPAYGEARRTFSAMSKPINEMEVGQAIADRSINPMADIRTGAGTIKPEMYAKALNDNTAAATLGRPSATLENTIQPRNLQKLQNVQEDLERAKFAQTAGKEGGGSDTTQKLAYANLLTQSGLPNWLQSIGGRTGIGGLAQKAGQVIYRDANQEMSAKLAQALLNPSDAASMMEAGAVTPQMQKLIEGLRRGGAGAGAMAPALLNTTQQ